MSAARVLVALIVVGVLATAAAIPVSAADSASATPTAPATDSPDLAGLDTDGDGLTDAFETRWGITAPDDRDSDADGIPDSIEDEDGDDLGNLGEQRYGTDPADPDSDADGVPDGAEDSDGDGRSDALEQDERPLPQRLRPTPAKAIDDRAKGYGNGCHSTIYDAVVHPCVYGDPDGETSIALYGDSHVLQWLPALEPVAEENGWRINALTKSACPSVEVGFKEPVKRTRRGKGVSKRSAVATCRTWRKRAQAWLDRNEPDLIIVSNRGRYQVVNARGKVLRSPAREDRWRLGLARTIRMLPDASRVVVIADTPKLRIEPAPCLAQNPDDISACQTPRERAMYVPGDDAERAAAEATGAWFTDLHEEVCPHDPCPVVVEDILMWRDKSHVTATYAKRLAPALEALVEKALDPGDSTSAP